MKKIIIAFALIFTISIASSSIVSFGIFDPDVNSTIDRGTIYSDSLVFQVQTSQRSFCKYGTSDDMSFDSMSFFEENLETTHKKTLTELSDGVHRYFVKCRDIKDQDNISKGKAQLEAIFTINSPIAAQIIMDNDLMNEGKYDISIITTKIPTSVPKLSYSFDGISYNPIVLFGSGKNWKGYLIIDNKAGEKTGSFKFEASDLEGRQGSKIISGSIFEVDTDAPSQISTIEGVGEYGQVRLEWFLPDEQDYSNINIYRSESPGVGYIDFYESIDGDKEEFLDTDVTKGKIYYYKIAPEDLAGNLASLSREIQVAPRSDNSIVSSNGLAPELISLVDSVLTEISLLESDIENSESIINAKNQGEKDSLKAMGVMDSLSSVKSETSALKREVENYKLQDLSSEVLESRLASSRVKINIIKKKVPESVSLQGSLSKENKIDDDSIRLGILAYSPDTSPSLIDKSVKETKNLAEEYNLKINSKVDIFEITYLDGSQEKKSLVIHQLTSTLERDSGAIFFLKIPTSISQDEIKIKNTDYSNEGEGSFSFKTDSKQISYIVDKEASQETLDNIELSLVKLVEESAPITGYFLYDLPDAGSIGIFLLMLLAGSLVVYLSIMKKTQENEAVSNFIKKAKEVKSLQKNGSEERAAGIYRTLQLDYANLSQEEKSKVFKEVKHLSRGKK